MSFADNLRAIRKDRDLSQEDLAELLNVSRQAVSKWEQGVGFPETEKMLMLSKELNISLDDLMYDGNDIESKVPQRRNTAVTGKIMIKSQDEAIIVNCYKVLSFPVSKKKDEPRYALYGVDGRSFLDENRVFLGWYADEDAIKKEIGSIWAALEKGESSYVLKHTAKVKKKFLSVKLDE